MELDKKAKKMIEELKEQDAAGYVLIADLQEGTKTSAEGDAIQLMKMLVALERSTKKALQKSNFPIPYAAFKKIVEIDAENSGERMTMKEQKED